VIETKPAKTRVHTVYKNKAGERVPSVTTILGVLNKPALLDWAWKCGCEGLDYKAVRDNAADIGTIAHGLILAHLTQSKFDTSEYSPADVAKAENCLIKYWDWEKANKVEPVLVESQMVSETYGFGGTIDCLARMNGELILIDHKTGKAIYSEMFYQLAAYRQLLKEQGHEIKNARILRIGRDEVEGFEERVMVDLAKHFMVFLHCMGLYNLQKELR
jgi:hypothetical protein